jgi:hypothetical protein
MSLTISKKHTQMMGPEITAAASKAFRKGTKQQTNYTWMSVMECRRRKWW